MAYEVMCTVRVRRRGAPPAWGARRQRKKRRPTKTSSSKKNWECRAAPVDISYYFESSVVDLDWVFLECIHAYALCPRFDCDRSAVLSRARRRRRSFFPSSARPRIRCSFSCSCCTGPWLPLLAGWRPVLPLSAAAAAVSIEPPPPVRSARQCY